MAQPHENEQRRNTGILHFVQDDDVGDDDAGGRMMTNVGGEDDEVEEAMATGNDG
jgi:hypothetical protein